MDCIFCKIINGEIPCKKVAEDDDFLAILDAFPANIAHTLVIPKKHFANIFDIDEDTLKKGHILAKKIALSIKNIYDCDINILQNNGKISGQSVEHFHIHIIPRYAKDGVVIKSDIININTDEMEKIREKIENNLKNNF